MRGPAQTVVVAICATLYGPTLSAQDPEPERRTTVVISGRISSFSAFQDPGISAQALGASRVRIRHHIWKSHSARIRTPPPSPLQSRGARATVTGHVDLAGSSSRKSIVVRPYLAGGGALYVTRVKASLRGETQHLGRLFRMVGSLRRRGGDRSEETRRAAASCLWRAAGTSLRRPFRVVAHFYLP